MVDQHRLSPGKPHEGTARSRVLAAAARLFAGKGYIATTVPHIAADSGVPVEQVDEIGDKPALLLQAFECALSGSDQDLRLWETGAAREAVEAPTVEDALDGLADLLTRSHQRSAALWAALVQGAEGDAELAGVMRIREAELRRQAAIALRGAVDRRLIPEPRNWQKAIDLCWVAAHPTQWALLVGEAGWSDTSFRGWLRSTYSMLLVEDSTRV